MEVRIKEPMSRHTTFRAGGEAEWFVMPETAEELAAVFSAAKKAGMDFYIIGNGSNLLVSDRGYDGVVISMENTGHWKYPARILRQEPECLCPEWQRKR